MTVVCAAVWACSGCSASTTTLVSVVSRQVSVTRPARLWTGYLRWIESVEAVLHRRLHDRLTRTSRSCLGIAGQRPAAGAAGRGLRSGGKPWELPQEAQ